jgi:hypothetical protein
MRNTDTNTECEGAALALPAAHQTAEAKTMTPIADRVISADDAAGMAWWNALADYDRGFWARAALSAVPADAWAYYKRVCREGNVINRKPVQPDRPA